MDSCSFYGFYRMLFLDKLVSPGEHCLMLPGVIGDLEACFTVPEIRNTQYVALLGHPHSLQGGTMNNKVVTTLARVFKTLGIASLRFNFRGVGTSAGVYDAGVGESEDMLCLARLCEKAFPGVELCFAGFSFGSYVAYRAAAQQAHALLVTIAPPVHHYDYLEWPISPPWLIVQGALDEVVPLSQVIDFSKKIALNVHQFPEAGHFFHGQLIALKDYLLDAIRTELVWR
jgi:alpha/beta superfamily hydrolase